MYSESIVTRGEALAAGNTFYFTGAQCRHGHTAPRYVTSRNCHVCSRARNKDRREYMRSYSWQSRGCSGPSRPEPTVCESCAQPPNGHGRLHLDHDHETGEFRGWLCSKCNTGIGLLGDTRSGLLAALKYFDKVVEARRQGS
jgi:hypothetical protein